MIYRNRFARIYIEINCNVITVLVWVKTLWTTVGGRISRHFFYKKHLPLRGLSMSELSIFIDESGDFGEIKERPAYYLVTMIFHDQAVDISKEIEKLEESMHISGFDLEYIHTGPVIRREQIFTTYSIEERRKLLYKMLYFYNKCNIHHDTVVVNRKEAPDKISLSGHLSKGIAKMIAGHSSYFKQFEKIIVYYDNGQTELSTILNAVFSALFHEVEFRRKVFL